MTARWAIDTKPEPGYGAVYVESIEQKDEEVNRLLKTYPSQTVYVWQLHTVVTLGERPIITTLAEDFRNGTDGTV